MIWFAPYDGFGDTDPLVPFARPQAPSPRAADASSPQPALDEAADGPAPRRDDERPPARASIK